MSFFELNRPPRPDRPSYAVMMMVVVAGIVSALIIHELGQRDHFGAGHGSLQIAEREFRAGDERQAFAVFQKLAGQNDPTAQYWAGHMTELGLGIPRDVPGAIALYQKAAARKDVPAELRLGEVYLHGDLVPPDFPKAKGYLERAANAGNARAALLLGQMYRLGLGMPADSRQACIWSEVSAIEGNAQARQARDALIPTLSASDQHTVSAQAKQILAAIKQATNPAPKARAT